MASNFKDLDLANHDVGQYTKSRLFFNNTAGIDLSKGGVFVKASGGGVIEATPSAHVRGIIFEAKSSAASGYVDVYHGLQDKFTGVVSAESSSGSANRIFFA